MAIAFASVTIHSRSQGYSAVAASAYRSGTVLRDERTGETHHYGHRTDIAYAQIMLPDGADEKFLDREYLWNEVERAEKRQDAQLAKDVILALPKELNLDQQITLARQFANYHFVSKGLVADVAIHNDEGNPHAHIYITTRRLIGDKFDRYKARDLNPLFANRRGNHGFIAEKDYWGEQWRTFQTDFFAEHYLEIVVDANYLVPTRHEGRIRESEHYLKEENQLRREANVELALESPESLLNLLSLQYSVFREADIQKLVFKQTQGSDAYNNALFSLKAHPDLIELENGIYTTKANYQQEASLADTAEHLVQQRDRVVSGLAIQAIGDEQQLSTEQRHALKHIATSGKLSAIVGRAGTGKSHLMKAVQILYQGQHRRIIGMAVSGVAAQNLQTKSGIPSRTVAYYRTLLQHNQWQLHKDDVIVIDEAGMVDVNSMEDILGAAKRVNAKVILVGDPDQLQPIGKRVFKALIERTGFAEMTHIMRQHDTGDREATLQLAQGQVKAALLHYERKGQLHLLESEQSTLDQVVHDWQQGLQSDNLEKRLMLTFQNKHVDGLNTRARAALQARGLLSQNQLTLETEKGTVALALGERIMFLRNINTQPIRNGEFATITAIEGSLITVKKNQQELTIDTRTYHDIAHGYAATIHKAQGADFDRIWVYVAGHYWDRSLSYVALSRHRERVYIYADQEHYPNLGLLAERMSKHTVRDNVMDWPISYAIRRGLDPDSLIGKTIDKIGQLHDKLQDKWLFLTNHEAYLLKQQHRALVEDRVKQQEQPATKVCFNLLDKEYHIEWENLRKSSNDKIQWAVNLYDLALSKQNTQSQQHAVKTLQKIFGQLLENEKIAPIMIKESPNLVSDIKRTISKSRNRGLDISQQ